MPHFFKHFPKVEYDIKKNGKTINLTNITQRFKIKENLPKFIKILQRIDL